MPVGPNVTPYLWEFNWLPIVSHAQFKVPALIHKAVYGLGPWYLKDHLFQYKAVLVLHSSEEMLLCVPRVAQLVGTWNRAFSLVAPEL